MNFTINKLNLIFDEILEIEKKKSVYIILTQKSNVGWRKKKYVETF